MPSKSQQLQRFVPPPTKHVERRENTMSGVFGRRDRYSKTKGEAASLCQCVRPEKSVSHSDSEFWSFSYMSFPLALRVVAQKYQRFSVASTTHCRHFKFHTVIEISILNCVVFFWNLFLKSFEGQQTVKFGPTFVTHCRKRCQKIVFH